MPALSDQERCSQPWSRTDQAASAEVRLTNAWAMPAETSSLPADYEELRERLETFSDVPADDRRWVMGQLLQWRQWSAARGKELPAPWIFAPDQKTVELEWHLGPRSLIVTMNRLAPLYCLVADESRIPPPEGEGWLSFPNEVAPLALWVVGD